MTPRTVIFTSLILFIPLFVLNAQKITVLDQSNNQPVESVVITGSGSASSIFTNVKGIADLSKIARSDTIKFYHIAYQFLTLS